MFVLKVMGTLSLQSKASPIPPEALQKKRLGLLALLAIAGRHGLARDRLHAFLWSESDNERSRHALDQLVYATRRALGSDPFLSAGQDLRLNEDIVDTDVAGFRRAVEDGDLENAVGNYGGILLDGFHIAQSRELEDWIDGQRARITADYQGTLARLAELARVSGDGVAEVRWRLKLAEFDPLSSRFAAEAIRAMIRAGNRTGALQHATSHQRRVKDELGVKADAEITSLAASLLHAGNTPATNGEPPPEAPVGLSPADTLPREPEKFLNSGPPPPPFSRRASTALAVSVMLGIAILVATYTTTRGDIRRESEAMGREHGQSARLGAAPYYHAGVTLWNDRSKEGLDSAVVLFRRAVLLDPQYAEAYAGLANAYVMLGYSGYRPAQAMFPKAKAAALRSIQLDSTYGPAYAALGMELTAERNFREAEAAFRKAVSLDSKYATAHQWYGILLMISGRKLDAVAELKRAAELDPLSLQIQNNYATFLSAAGDPGAALRHYEKMVAEEPDTAWVGRNPWLLTNMAQAYAAAGRFDTALEAAQRAVRILPDHPRALAALAAVYRRMGRTEDARQTFARADKKNEHYPAYRALTYLGEGNSDSAFVWFGRVREWGIPIMISLARVNPAVASDPRYVRLLQSIGMPVRSQ